MKMRFIALAVLAGLLVAIALVTPAQATVRWGCPSGVGCIWSGYNGGGDRLTASVSSSGINVCHNLPGFILDNRVSSVSDDYGNSLDLVLFAGSNCSTGGHAELTFYSGERCCGTDQGMWSFGSFAFAKYDNVESSYLITHLE